MGFWARPFPDREAPRSFPAMSALSHSRRIVAVRLAIAICLVPLLVYLCLQTDHARLKGMPMDTWRLIPLILTAAAFALIGKRFVNSIAGLFLGGIGGAFGTLDNFAGPYGGVVGLVVGAIVIAIPIMHKPRKTDVRHDGEPELESGTLPGRN